MLLGEWIGMKYAITITILSLAFSAQILRAQLTMGGMGSMMSGMSSLMGMGSSGLGSSMMGGMSGMGGMGSMGGMSGMGGYGGGGGTYMFLLRYWTHNPTQNFPVTSARWVHLHAILILYVFSIDHLLIDNLRL